jgi:hypothetical protein
MLHEPLQQSAPLPQVAPVGPQAGPPVPDAWQSTELPYIVVSTGGATAFISMAMSAPVSAAVAQTFALARVSAPIICPEAYTTAPTTTISMETTGSNDTNPAQKLETELVTLSRGVEAERAPERSSSASAQARRMPIGNASRMPSVLRKTL